MTDISRAIRELVLARDSFVCVSCRRHVGGMVGYSIHHRVPRGMGGSKLPWINQPGNLLTLCGSATTGCHQWVESHRDSAYEWGYLIRRYHGNFQPPEFVKVLTAGGWVLFDNEGSLSYVQRPNVTPERHRELDAEVDHARSIRMGVAA